MANIINIMLKNTYLKSVFMNHKTVRKKTAKKFFKKISKTQFFSRI